MNQTNDSLWVNDRNLFDCNHALLLEVVSSKDGTESSTTEQLTTPSLIDVICILIHTKHKTRVTTTYKVSSLARIAVSKSQHFYDQRVNMLNRMCVWSTGTTHLTQRQRKT